VTSLHRWGTRAALAAICGLLVVVAAPTATDAVDSVVGPVSVRSAAEASHHAIGTAIASAADRSGPVAGSFVQHPADVGVRRVISTGNLRRKAPSAVRGLLAALAPGARVDATVRQPQPPDAAPADATQRGPDLSRSPPRASPADRARAAELTRRPHRVGIEPGGTSCLMSRTTSTARSPAPRTG
jgi:hypothetical protein